MTLLHMFLSSQKHPNNRNKICLQLSSAYNWFSVLTYNSDVAKFEWIPLLFNFNQIYDLSNKSKLFSISVAEYASFSHQTRTLETDLLKCLKLVLYHFLLYIALRVARRASFFLSSLVFTPLEFHSNYFGILLWKLVKPSEHNESKPPIRKIFQKYKPINKTTSQK